MFLSIEYAYCIFTYSSMYINSFIPIAYSILRTTYRLQKRKMIAGNFQDEGKYKKNISQTFFSNGFSRDEATAQEGVSVRESVRP